ncbi:MAG: hypothetical protein HY769_05305, partial [Candidatus Stahlbacteria bacterium]|nr:hypothetical protein [Candidatus Stahlbacteria bacterium]
AWQKNLIAYIVANAAQWGFTAAEITILTGLQTKWVLSYIESTKKQAEYEGRTMKIDTTGIPHINVEKTDKNVGIIHSPPVKSGVFKNYHSKCPDETLTIWLPLCDSVNLNISLAIGNIEILNVNGVAHIKQKIGELCIKNSKVTIISEKGIGNSTFSNIDGNIELGEHTQGDTLLFEKVNGDIKADAFFKEIKIIDCRGKISISNSIGNIYLKDGSGEAILKCDGGEITCEGFDGKIVNKVK